MRKFANPVSKKIRKSAVNKITTEELNGMVNEIEKLIDNTIDDNSKEEDKSVLYSMTGYHYKNAVDEVSKILYNLIEKDLAEIMLQPQKNSINKEESTELRIGNQSDAAYLAYFYCSLLLEQSRYWNKIVDMVDVLRNEEIEDMADMEFNNNLEGSEKFMDIRKVLMRAALLVNEQEK